MREFAMSLVDGFFLGVAVGIGLTVLLLATIRRVLSQIPLPIDE